MSMTGDTHSPKDDDALFFEMMNASWEKMPELRESMDAGIRRFLEKVEAVGRSLSRDPEFSDDRELNEVLENINSEWEELVGEEEEFRLTGKVRPTSEALDNDVLQLVEADAFSGIKEVHSDSHGEYFQAAGFGVEVHLFDLDEEGRPYLLLGVPDDEEDMDGWFMAYPEDIELLEGSELTREGLENVLNKYYPELYARILELPQDCGDDERIVRELMNFTVSYNPNITDGVVNKSVLQRGIELYITSHLKFDTSTYSFFISGAIEGQDDTFSPITIQMSGQLRQTRIDAVRLHPIGVDAAGEITYEAMLEVWYPVPRRGGGRTPLYLPMDTIIDIQNERPKAEIYQLPSGLYVVPDGESEYQAVEPFPDDLETRTITDEKREDAEKELSHADYEEKLEKFEHTLQQVLAKMREVSLQRVATREELSELWLKCVHNIEELLNNGPKVLCEIEFSGLGVAGSQATHTLERDEEKGIIEQRSLYHDPVEDDNLATKSGTIKSYSAGIEEDEQGFRLRPFFEMNEKQQIIRPGSYHEVTVETNFRAYADKELHVTLPTLERIRQNRDMVKQIDRFSNNPSLHRQLEELGTILQNEDLSEYAEMDVSVLHRIANLSKDLDVEKLGLDDTLSGLFGQRHIEITGEIYGIGDALAGYGELSGNLLQVIGGVPGEDGQGVSFVIDMDGETYYTPFKDLESVMI